MALQTIETLQNPKLKEIKFIRKNTKNYTDTVFQDNQLFNSITLKGCPMQVKFQIDKSEEKKRSKSVNTQAKQVIKQKFEVKKQENNFVGKGANKTTKYFRRQSQKKEEKASMKKSITIQSVQKIKRVKTERNKKQEDQPDKKTMKYPQIAYKEQNLVEQFCNFKQILDEFNKTKLKIKQNQIRGEDKKYKTFYKKPNFYQYQEFYKQNAQAKQLRETMMIFHQVQAKKCNLSNQKQHLYRRKSKPDENYYRTTQFCIKIDPTIQKVIDSARIQHQAFPSYLQIKSHGFTRFDKRQNKQVSKKKIFNKSGGSMGVGCFQLQHEKIEPWGSDEIADNFN